MPEHHHHQHHHDQHGDLADLLELDAAVLREFHAGIVGWVGEHVPDARNIVDIGAGTGTGTLALLEQYADATVVAVDSSADMLHRLAGKAPGRVRTLEADLDHGWPAGAGHPDLVWATNSMHHMADPGRVLRDIRDALAPGGALALMEIDGFPRFLHDELEERLHAAMARRRAHDMPHLGDDWGAALREAGFVVRAERRFSAHVTGAPLAARYAQASFERLRDEDPEAVDEVLQTLPHRDDLTVRAERSGWIAVRPA
jgi:SAM-dependent methyltransferase